ncbi:hypothetical protein KA005_27135, partial [bacterium]|nr:hypothetical protein [bacterium]
RIHIGTQSRAVFSFAHALLKIAFAKALLALGAGDAVVLQFYSFNPDKFQNGNTDQKYRENSYRYTTSLRLVR